MAIHSLRSLLLGAGLFLLPAMACATSFADRLREADAVRSGDSARFVALVDGLARDRDQADESELRHLRLLQDYRRAFAGDYQGASADAMALVEQAPEPVLRYRAALLVSNIAALKRDYLVGLRYLDRALSMRDRIEDPAIRNLSGTVAGTLYNEFGHYELALNEAERVLADHPDPHNRCGARQIRARALNGLGRRLDEGRDIQEAIADCAAQRQPMAVNAIRATLAEYWAAHGRRKQAIALLEKNLPETLDTGYTRLIGEVRQLLAQFHLDEGDVAKAQAQARAIVTAPGQDPTSLATVVAHRVLYLAAMQRGDTAEAFRHYRLYAEADKARLDDIKAREYAFQLSRHEIKQKNQSIALLTSKNRLLSLQQEVDRRTKWNFSLAIALLLVLVASFGYWGWRARRMHGSLRRLAETDGLTGLANRRHFRERSEAVLAACAERRRPVSVLLLDLDHFKQINDQCGHAAGDWVLREVARVGRLHCREQDLFGRLGGEEFALTLVDCDADAAMRTAEACRRAIASIDAGSTGCGLPVTASVGVVATRAASDYDYEALIAHADAAMYRSKLAGRNRVALYTPPPVPGAGQAEPALDRRNAEAMLREY